jgi:hypothetical protein
MMQTAAPARRPTVLLTALAAAVVALEGLVLLGFGAWVGVALVASDAADRGGAAVEVIFCVLIAAALLGCAWGMLRGRRWARGPVLTWQLLQAAAALPALGQRWYVGAGLLLLSLLVLVAVVRPPATSAETAS